jgi:hypothetical protein
MKITQLTPGATPDYTLTGGVLTIAGHAIDIEAEAGDGPVSVDISLSAGAVHRGLGERYLANVLLPARRYTEALDGEEMVSSPLPVDTDEIELRLYEVINNG